MLNKQCSLAAAVLALGGSCGAAMIEPDIGGVPLYSETDAFSGSPVVDWGMTAYSYVFDSSSDLPESFSLKPGQMLFMYLLDGDDSTIVSVDKFTVGNPDDIPITEVGFATAIVPEGFDSTSYEDPYLYSYSQPAQAIVYTYAGDFSDPYSTLDPDEWSLVWYIAEAGGWTLGSATASGGGYGDTELVPIPILPQPGAAVLLGLAGTAWLRRRGR